jgi:hypothetical protein
MSFAQSMVYTMGTALSRAEQCDLPVEVLVGGQWLTGRVVGNDGTGLVLAGEQGEHAVVRIESITAVRVFTDTPHDRAPAAARPMPRQRSA